MNVPVAKSGKDLLYRAIDYLDNFRCGQHGGNVTKYPTIVVFMGEISCEFLSTVKQTLDDNWNNSIHLEYINLCADGKSCRRLEIDQDNYDVFKWVDCVDFVEELNRAAADMLGKSKIFEDCTSVKIDFILDATEDNAQLLYEAFRDCNLHILVNTFKSLYLMINQRHENGFAERSEKLTQNVLHDKKRKRENIYLISNQTSRGNFLGKGEEWQNYRLVGDIIIIGGNRDNNKGDNIVLDPEIKTVAYALLTKPSDQIGEVAVYHLLKELFKQSEKRSNAAIGVSDILDTLEVREDGSMEMADRILNEIEEEEYVSKNAIYYLPFRSLSDFNRMKHEIESGKAGINIRKLDSMTYGVASLYVDEYFNKPVSQRLDDSESREAIRAEIVRYISARFNCFELEAMRSVIEDVKNRFFQQPMPGRGQSRQLGDVFTRMARSQMRELFYNGFKELFWDVFSDMVSRAASFRSDYLAIQSDNERERYSTGEEDKSIETVFGDMAAEYVTSRLEREGTSAFADVFNVYNSRENIAQAIMREYCRMVNEDDRYKRDFENTMKLLLNVMAAKGKAFNIADELALKMGSGVRVMSSIPSFVNRLISRKEYYLVSEEAEYTKYLKNTESYDQGAFELFCLNRTDCIEQLKIFAISDVDMLHLVKVEDDDEL